MIKLFIGDAEYEANEVFVRDHDISWGDRQVAIIKLAMNYEEALETFVDNIEWGTERGDYRKDMSNFCLSGAITDNRDGTCTIVMGKKLDLEKLIELHYGGVNNEGSI